MNREQLGVLADALDRDELNIEFDMAEWRTCLAACAVAYFDPLAFTLLWPASFAYRASEILKLTSNEASDLFYANRVTGRCLDNIRKSDAVRCLREAARTGVIDWERAI